MVDKIAWCTSQYSTDFTKEKAKELRSQGYSVSFGGYVKESGKTYCRIYLEQDLNYFILSSLKSIEINIKYGKSIEESILLEKEKIKSVCERFSTPVRIELIDREVVAVVDDEYKLCIGGR